MKKFAFTLQPVLDHRARIEDERTLETAERKRELDEALAHLSELDGSFRAHAEALRCEHRRFAAEDLRLHYAHLTHLDAQITLQMRIVAERRSAHERARERLLEASKDRKIVETLKERKLSAQAAEERRIEQNELDDANARRHARASKGTR